MTTEGTHRLWRDALLIFSQKADDARHSADAITNLGKQFRSRAGAQVVQVLGATLEAEPVECVEVNHGAAFRPGGGCTKQASWLIQAALPSAP